MKIKVWRDTQLEQRGIYSDIGRMCVTVDVYQEYHREVLLARRELILPVGPLDSPEIKIERDLAIQELQRKLKRAKYGVFA